MSEFASFYLVEVFADVSAKSNTGLIPLGARFAPDSDDEDIAYVRSFGGGRSPRPYGDSNAPPRRFYDDEEERWLDHEASDVFSYQRIPPPFSPPPPMYEEGASAEFNLFDRLQKIEGFPDNVLQPLFTGIVNLKSLPEIWLRNDSPISSTETKNAWRTLRSSLPAYMATADLATIHSAEYYTDELGQHRLTLHCPEGPEGPEDSSPQSHPLVKMRWM